MHDRELHIRGARRTYRAETKILLFTLAVKNYFDFKFRLCPLLLTKIVGIQHEVNESTRWAWAKPWSTTAKHIL